MGTYLNYFIEYRNRPGDKWHLVSTLVPTEKHSYPEYCKKRVIDGVEYCVSIEVSRQGHVRDVFSSRGWYDAPFTSRGFPEDMSDELKQYLEQCKIDEWESQKKEKDPDYEYEIVNGVLTKMPRKEPLSIEKDYQDYRYDKTWATLSELSNFQENEVRKIEDRIKEEQEKDKFTKLNERIDKLESLIINGEKEETDSKDESDEDDGYDYVAELQEELDDARFFGEWVYGVNAIVDFYNGGWNDYENIRVIANLS